VDWQVLVSHDWSPLVNWLTDDVHDSSKGGWADWHGDGVSSVGDILTSDETLGGVQSNSSNVVASQVLGDFQNQSVLDSLHFECIENRWELAFELDIDDGTNDLRDLSYGSSRSTEAFYKTKQS
jgi:hypothetical protein